jgi:hypothetical protein
VLRGDTQLLTVRNVAADTEFAPGALTSAFGFDNRLVTGNFVALVIDHDRMGSVSRSA